MIASNSTTHNCIQQASQGKLPPDLFDSVLDKLLYCTNWHPSSKPKIMPGSWDWAPCLLDSLTIRFGCIIALISA